MENDVNLQYGMQLLEDYSRRPVERASGSWEDLDGCVRKEAAGKEAGDGQGQEKGEKYQAESGSIESAGRVSERSTP